MHWYLENQDAIIFVIIIVIAAGSYWIGAEVGYCKGLADGFKDGQLNGPR